MNIEQKIIKMIKDSPDKFFTPNCSAFYGSNIDELFKVIYELCDKGVIRRRDCVGLAYELV